MSQLNRPGAAAVSAAARQRMMRVCAEATEAELESALAAIPALPEIKELRPPEQGLVMLRGRIGGSGSPFNVGEATVTRAVVEIAGGFNGYSYLLGRCPRRARLAAVIDALAQDAGYAPLLESVLVAPVETRCSAERARSREEAAATRVDFFTMVRGKD